MRRSQIFLAMAMAVLIRFTGHAMATEDVGGIIHVTGTVLCQDCGKGWKEWVYGGRPLKDVIVSVTCKDDRNRVFYYARDRTDGLGRYLIVLKKIVNGKAIRPHLCLTRLISSPDPSCDRPTNFGGGLKGVRLAQPSSILHNLIKFDLSRFYYTTPMCEEPDTTASSSSDNKETPAGGY